VRLLFYRQPYGRRLFQSEYPGGTNDRTLYRMDDVPVCNRNHTFGLIPIFNPDALLGADIYKGGLPAVSGVDDPVCVILIPGVWKYRDFHVILPLHLKKRKKDVGSNP
jgi:hypothetical protein